MNGSRIDLESFVLEFFHSVEQVHAVLIVINLSHSLGSNFQSLLVLVDFGLGSSAKNELLKITLKNSKGK